MPNRLKAIPQIAIAFLEHTIGTLIGDKTRDLITGQLIGFDKSQVNAYLQRQESDTAIDKALSIVGSKFRHNPRDLDLHEQMNALALSGNPAIEDAIHQFANHPDVTILENAVWEALKTVDWKISLSQDEMERGVKRYLYELQLALLPVIPEVIIGSSVLRTEQKVDELTKQVAILVGREQSRLILSYKDTFEPLALPSTDALPDPTTLPPGSRLELPRNEVFTGREDELKQLANILLHGSGQKTACISTGYGGIGKTQLAIEFAYRFGRYFRGVHWLSARSGRLEDDIAACGRQMGIDIQELEGQVNQTIAQWQNSPPRLIIIDNAENPAVLQDWWATFSDMRVLITSRRTQWSPSLGLTQLDLKELTPEQARDLLRKLALRLKNVADGELDEIGKKLGFLPLALDLVGRYLKENSDLTPSNYVKAVERVGNSLDHESLKRWFGEKDFSATQQQRNVIACFDLSWAQIGYRRPHRNVNMLAQKVLRGCGYCAPNEPIPVQLLVRAFESEEDENAPSVRQALRRLFEVGLLRQTQEGEVGPTIHPLMAEYARLKDEADDESALEPMADALAILATQAGKTGLPQEFVIWLPHIELMAHLAEIAGNEDAGVLWNNLGYHRQDIADYSGAYTAYEHALTIDEAVFGNSPHHNVARDVNNLGSVLKFLGDLTGARTAYERALAIDEVVFGREHPNVATDLNNLGSVLQEVGDLVGAHTAFERALSIDRAVFGREHPKVAIRVNNLGNVLNALGDLLGARAAYEWALAIFRKVLGENHPNVATLYNNLGGVLQDLGNLDGARSAFEHALAIWQAIFGEYHPQVAIGHNNLGTLLQDLGNFVGAKVAHEQALAIDKSVFGEEHPVIARDLNNLGHLYWKTGDLEEAKIYFEQALAIFAKSQLPPDHPYIQATTRSLDIVNRHLGE